MSPLAILRPAVFAAARAPVLQARALSTTARCSFKIKKEGGGGDSGSAAPWSPSAAVNYDELKKYTSQPTNDVIVIDTREPDDVTASPIRSTVNIPLSRVADALSPNYHPGNFQKEFAFPKPENTQKMVFIDRSGKRSAAAVDAAHQAGYPNARNYGAGLADWEENEKKH